MTPQERQLVDELFARLAQLENQPREADAVAAINDGLKRAPNALYALVQTVLLQEEALKRAHAQLEALGGAQDGSRGGGFLDSMRDTMFGGGRRGSVPSVRPGDAGQTPWAGQQQPPQQQGGGFGTGGSFLGTAAAAAAGMIGGSLLMNSLGSIFGGGDKAHAFGSTDKGGDKSPWNDNSGGDLSRDAGLGDIGGKGSDRQGFFDNASHTDLDDDGFGDFTDGGGDGGGD